MREMSDAEVFGQDPETDALVRTVWGEARGEGAGGRKAVASVIRNRARLTSQPVSAVVRERGQFEPWGNPATRQRMEGLDPASEDYQAILRDIQGDDDPTGGATHFYAPKAQAALGRAPPAWDDGSGVDLGSHRFFKRPYGGQPAAEMSDAEVFGTPERISTSKSGGVTVDRIPQRPAPAAPVPQRTSIPLGVAKGVVEPYARLGARGETPLTTAMLRGPGMFTPLGLGSRALDAASGMIAAQEQRGVKPSKGGQFAGGVLGSLPLAFAPGVGPAASGALTGALQSEGEGLGDVSKDMAFGAAAGKLGDKALKVVGSGVSSALSKAPKVMDLAGLEGAVKAAYKRVDDSGFRLPSADLNGLVKQVTADLREKGGPKAARLFPDADALVSRLDALAKAKGGAKLTQLDTLRSDIYDVLVKPGGKEASIGKAMRAKIDELIDAVPNADIKGARDLYKRLSKTRTVTNKLEAADLQAGRAYTGKNVNNAIRQKLSPLVDPTSAQRIKNATPDEAAALRRAVVGSPAQNLVRSAGTMLDPRGIIGMGLQSAAGVKTAGLSLASVPLGLLATATGNRMSQKNVNELLRLIAVGGSKEALKKTPTTASRAAVKATSAARPAVTTAGAALAIQPPQKKRAK